MRYSLSRATLYNLSSYFYLLLATLATTPSLIRSLTLPAFGRYVLALGILSLLTSLDLGLSRSVVFHLARARTKLTRTRLLSASLFLHLILGLVFGIIACFWFSLPLGLLVFLTYLLAHFQTEPESLGAFGLINFRAFVIGTCNTAGALLLATLGYGLSPILHLLSFATLLTLVLFYSFSSRSPLRFPRWQDSVLLLRYGLRVQFGKFVNALGAQYPKFLLSANPLSLTVYSLASSLVSKGVAVVSQLAIATFPATSRNLHNPRLVTLYRRSQLGLVVLALLAYVAYEYLGLSLLTWWLAEPSLAAMVDAFLRTYRYYGLLLLLTPLASTVLDSANRPGLSSLYAALALLVELVIVLCTYRSLGIMSFAFGPTLSLLLFTPVLLLTAQRILRSGENKAH